MLINWHLQGEELKHNITQSLRSLTNTTTHFLIFRFSRSLSHLMVRYVYFWPAGSLSFFCKVQDQFIGFLWRPFQLAPVTKLLNLNAPQSVSLSAVPLGNINILLFTKITFLTFFLPKLSFYNLIYFSLAAREIGRQADWIGKHFPMPFAFPVKNVNSFFENGIEFLFTLYSIPSESLTIEYSLFRAIDAAMCAPTVNLQCCGILILNTSSLRW